MVHRLRRPWLDAPCLAVVCLAIAGCAAGGAQSPSASPSDGVALILTAPTSGATVGVHQIEVTGTVAPLDAVVRVAGQPASVGHGRFTRLLVLSRPTTTIEITAASTGHAPATITTTVHFSSELAASLIAAHKASVSTATQGVASVTAPSAAKAPVLRAAHPRSTGPAAPTPRSKTTTTTTTMTTKPGSSPSAGSGSAAAPTSGPPAPAPLSPAQIRQRYLKGCTSAGGGQPAVPYCTCIYEHLLQSGALTSPASIAALEHELSEFAQTQDIFKLPAYLRAALSECASKLPAAPLPVTKLPQLHHRPAGPKATTSDRSPDRHRS
jgi:hypothetical protein